MDHQTTKALIKKSCDNDTGAFRKLVEAHQSFIYATAFRLLCNEYETEEVTQETFIKVWKNLNNFNNDMRFTTWLRKIVVNLCYDKLKARKRRNNNIVFNSENQGILNHPSEDDIEKELSNHEMAEIIGVLSDQLTPKQKMVFVLSELEGLTTDEIFEISGLSAGKIKSNLYCARQTIKEKLIKIEERRMQ
jgi:RNA polymerase sigma-70 factor (ECF subfamily)